MHLKHLNEHYAHQVSKEIIDFCKEKHTGILVLPEYDEDFSRISTVDLSEVGGSAPTGEKIEGRPHGAL